MAKYSGIAYLARMASQEIEALSQALARLPGLGPRSARRAVLHLMKKREAALQPLLAALKTVADKLSTCSTCGNVDTKDPCGICSDPRRDPKSLCVVEEVADLWALDRSRLFPGRYHVLGGRLSALEGVRPEDLAIDGLVKRVAAGGIDEVWPLALEGRIELIVVEAGYSLAVRFGPTAELIRADDIEAPDVVDDIVDDTIEAVLRTGGRAVIVEDGTLEREGCVAGVVRY